MQLRQMMPLDTYIGVESIVLKDNTESIDLAGGFIVENQGELQTVFDT